MNEIIEINNTEIGGNTIQTVNARDLHAFLENKRKFSDWIKQRISQYDFVEGEDYVIHKFVNNLQGGRPTIDYHISVPMAKELSMVENNSKGKEARKYFIECEKKVKGVVPTLPQDYPSALRALAEEVEKKEQLLIENKQQADKIEKYKPLVEMARALMDLGEEEGKTRPAEFTKSLEGVYGIGRNTFYEIFREMGIWNENNIPYARFVQAGYFLVREKPWYNKHSGMEGVTQIVWITPKGRKYLINRINKAFSEEA